MTGDLWVIPGGHRAIEVEGSTDQAIRVRIIQEGEWLQRAMMVPRELCEPGQMRYYGETSRED